MSVQRALLLGTSRLHRPFARRSDGVVQVNAHDGVEPVFAKAGYFHTAAEALQVLRLAKDPDLVPSELRSRIFRIEPRATTPLNEFDADLESAIRAGTACPLPFDVEHVDAVVIEVSSLTVNTHTPSTAVLHTNPNMVQNIPYSDLYPEGYYAKVEPDLPVVRSETTVDVLTAQLRAARAEVPWARILVQGHIRSPQHPNHARDRIHAFLVEACASTGCEYVDTAPFLDEFGFAEAGGNRDPHHLSLDGEVAFGQFLQARIASGAPRVVR